MGFVTKRILVFLVICFFVHSSLGKRPINHDPERLFESGQDAGKEKRSEKKSCRQAEEDYNNKKNDLNAKINSEPNPFTKARLQMVLHAHSTIIAAVYKKCKGLRECSDNSHDCDINAVCKDTNTAFTCSCKAGYNGNGVKCTAKDECVKNGEICSSPLRCQKQDDGSHACGCGPGYKVIGEGKNRACEALDECEKQGKACQSNLWCIEQDDGSHECGCIDGYNMVDSGDGKTCEEQDECEKKGHPCPSALKCKQQEDGSHACGCEQDGYAVRGAGDERTCEVMNECENNGDPCTSPLKCKEQADGSYACGCEKLGYVVKGAGDDRTCEDANECEGPENPCKGKGQICENMDGGYECNCKTGYRRIGSGCMPADKCLNVKCSAHELCYQGKCVCRKGYRKSGTKGKCAKSSPFKAAASAHSSSLGIYLGVLITGYLGRLAFTA